MSSCGRYYKCYVQGITPRGDKILSLHALRGILLPSRLLSVFITDILGFAVAGKVTPSSRKSGLAGPFLSSLTLWRMRSSAAVIPSPALHVASVLEFLVVGKTL